MANVYTYWECSHCGHLMRGDVRECPNCGAPIPNGVKYLMPDNPKVVSAMASGRIHTSGPTHIDEKGIISEVVDKKDERFDPNWECSFCGYQNRAEDTTCRGCGAGKEDSEKDYFGHKPTMSAKNRKDFEDRRGLSYHEYINEYTSKSDNNSTSESDNWTKISDVKFDERPTKEPEFEESHTRESEKETKKFSFKDFFINHFDIFKYIFCGIGIVGLIIFLVWLFTPITRTAIVKNFSWNRSIAVEQYTECHESDWSLPNGAILEDSRQEIHHYDHVIDHYETKTRQVAETVLVGYDTSYRDLGNGQAEVVQTPVYETQYHTETYQEPVYKDVPVYKTKYYYEIGRWKVSSSLDTYGLDQEPYWHDTDLPTNVDNPQYGDLRQGNRSETYIVIILDYNEQTQRIKYNYSDWINTNIGDKIEYKTFRFSDKPL